MNLLINLAIVGSFDMEDKSDNDKTNAGYTPAVQNGISLLDDKKEQTIEVDEPKPCSC